MVRNQIKKELTGDAVLSARRGEERGDFLSKFQISLAAARVNAGLTQSDVAQEMHISKQTVVNWEKGATEPSVNQARNLSVLYGIPLDHIYLPCKSN